MNENSQHEAQAILADIKGRLDESRARFHSDEEWARAVLPAVLGGLMSGVGRGHASAVFASSLTPTEFHAWDALEKALQAWPGPGASAMA